MGGEHRVAPLRSAVRAEEKTVFADQEAKTPAPATVNVGTPEAVEGEGGGMVAVVDTDNRTPAGRGGGDGGRGGHRQPHTRRARGG